MDVMNAGDVLDRAVEKETDALFDVSKKIWSNPECRYEEVFAHDTLTRYLDTLGFQVERNYKLATAFRATYSQGQGGAHVMVICEYDALPEIGHACGHHLIAQAGLVAGLGIKALLENNPEVAGSVTVLGTPAEESAGGKIELIRYGAITGFDVALMAHPDQTNMSAPIALANNHGTATFIGRAAHAAAAPWEGINALDACVAAYNSLSTMRQQTKPECRMHAIIKEGGDRANIIPERAVMEFIVRAPTDKELSVLKERVTQVMHSSAQATGCTLNLEFAEPDQPAHYSNMVHNPDLTARFQQHWKSLKPADDRVVPNRVWASTDMGNISYVVPSIHPTFSIQTSANIHTREFTAAAMTPEAHAATRCVGNAMALVGWDCLTDAGFLRQVKESFKGQLADLL